MNNSGIFYRHIKTKEIVFEEDAEQYVLDKLGITITPKGKNGELTSEQIENIEATKEWYFSSDWIKEIQVEEEGNVFELINEECEMEDM